MKIRFISLGHETPICWSTRPIYPDSNAGTSVKTKYITFYYDAVGNDASIFLKKNILVVNCSFEFDIQFHWSKCNTSYMHFQVNNSLRIAILILMFIAATNNLQAQQEILKQKYP